MTPTQIKILKQYALATLGVGAVAVSLYFGGYNEETQKPDPITISGDTIEFTWTDDNTDESLLIYTDKQTYYNGFSNATVYVAVTNQSGVDQDVSLMGSFVNERRSIKNVSVLTTATFLATSTDKGNCLSLSGAQVQTQINSGKNPDDYFITETTATGTTPRMFEVCTKVLSSAYSTSSKWVPLPQTKRDIYEVAIEQGYLDKLAKIRKAVDGYVAENKTLSFPIKAGETMYYKLDIEYPANDSGNFYLEAVGSEGAYGHLDPWFDAAWGYRVSVTVDDAKVPGTVSSFPVFVDLSDLPASFFTNAKSDGCDIRVVESDETTETPFELVSYSAGGTGELHFMADSLTGSGGGDTTFYIYYGNSSASCYATSDTYGRDNVWGDYLFVHHAEGSVGSAKETNATGDTAFDAVTSGSTASDGWAGQSNGGYAVSVGGSDYVRVPDNASFPTSGPMTIQGWVYFANAASPDEYFLSKYNNSPQRSYFLNRTSTEKLRYVQYNTTPSAHDVLDSSTTFNYAGWRKITAKIDGSGNQKLIVDGTEEASSALAATSYRDTTGNFQFYGLDNGVQYDFDGKIDEVRFRLSFLSADWDTTEYNNQSDTSTFYTIGSEEAYSGAARRVLFIQ